MTSILPCVEIETAPQPEAAVIWMHGLGADGHDFAAIVPELDLRGCPPIRFVFPHAPAMAVTLNGGYVMPAWYDIRGANLVAREDAAGIHRSARAITALIERETARGVPHQNIVLAGFSQGCAMALHTGLRHPHALAGIIALSGYLPLADSLTAERHPANASTPVFMAHGSIDPVVIPSRGEATREKLANMGYAVTWKTYQMGHSVHPLEIADISRFLQQVLG
jgi:phospholipase/carboxylesterase